MAPEPGQEEIVITDTPQSEPAAPAPTPQAQTTPVQAQPQPQAPAQTFDPGKAQPTIENWMRMQGGAEGLKELLGVTALEVTNARLQAQTQYGFTAEQAAAIPGKTAADIASNAAYAAQFKGAQSTPVETPQASGAHSSAVVVTPPAPAPLPRSVPASAAPPDPTSDAAWDELGALAKEQLKTIPMDMQPGGF